MEPQPRRIEPLEPRVAPAGVFVFTDLDGDRVTLKWSRGPQPALEFSDGSDQTDSGTQPRQLQRADFSDPAFAKANITVLVKRSGGDGLTDVGVIYATGVDLGAVKIRGDLGKILAGDSDLETKAVRGLVVQSMGALGVETQPSGGDLESVLVGSTGAIRVIGDFADATLRIEGAGTRVASIVIGGDLVGVEAMGAGSIFAEGSIGMIRMNGDLRGGAGADSGTVSIAGDLGRITVRGSVVGGEGEGSGSIRVGGKLGPVVIGEDLQGGSGVESGSVIARQSVAVPNLLIGSGVFGGSVIGGTANGAGSILIGDQAPVVKRGGVLGIRGSLIGPAHDGADSLTEAGAIVIGTARAVLIGGDVIGGIAIGSGEVTLTGAIASTGRIGSLIIAGDVLGNASQAVQISAAGLDLAPTKAVSAFGKLTFRGYVIDTRIEAGVLPGSVPIHADATIGPVLVRGDFVRSDIAAGVAPGADAVFGTDDDALFSGPDVIDQAGRQSRIAAVTVRGALMGMEGGPHGIVAEEIGRFRVGKTGIALMKGAHNDVLLPLPASLGAVFVHEV